MADVAENAELPVVACQAWQLLDALSRPRDPQEATRGTPVEWLRTAEE